MTAVPSTAPTPADTIRVDGLRVGLAIVAERRRLLAAAEAVVHQGRVEWELAHAAEIDALNAAKAGVEVAESELKALAAPYYESTGDKHPTPGLTIAEMKVHEITDPVAALAWAKQTGMGLLPENFDPKMVIKFHDVSPLPFARTTIKPQVRIASDLDKVLAAGGAQ